MERERTNKSLGITLGIPQLMVVGLLIIGAYLLGNLKAKVEYLEGNKGTAAAGNTAPAAAVPQAPSEPLTADNVPKVTKDDWVKGNRNAQIALIEYSDYECPFCKRFHTTAQQVVDTYKDTVMWVYRHYPLSFHANAEKEAQAAECAGELGGNTAFWKYTDALYEKTQTGGTGFALDALVPLAKELGLNEAKFRSCLDSGKYAQKIKDQMDAGTQAGVSGTPGNILLNVKTGETRLIAGAVPFEQIKAAIDEMLAK